MVNTLFWQAAATCMLSIFTSTAQARSGCNPLSSTTTCIPDPALGMAASFSFDSGDSSVWSPVGEVNFTTEGAAFEINREASTGWLQSSFYIFYGRYETWMQGANGTGIDMSMFLLSDIADEIAFTISSDNSSQARLQSISRSMNETYKVVDLGVDTTADLHNYTIVWTEETIEWYFDQKIMSTINSTALGDKYPKSPMLVGVDAGYNSAASRSNNADSNAFAYVWNATIEDYSTGANYTYVNISGTDFDIEITDGTSDVAQTVIDDGDQVASDGTTESASSNSSSSSKHSAAPAMASPFSQTSAIGLVLVVGFLLL